MFLRKRQAGEARAGPAWQEIVPNTNSLGETIPLNEYFAARPERMLGEMQLAGRMYRQSEPTLVGNGRDLGEQLNAVIQSLPTDIYRPVESPSSVPGAVLNVAIAADAGDLARGQPEGQHGPEDRGREEGDQQDGHRRGAPLLWPVVWHSLKMAQAGAASMRAAVIVRREAARHRISAARETGCTRMVLLFREHRGSAGKVRVNNHPALWEGWFAS